MKNIGVSYLSNERSLEIKTEFVCVCPSNRQRKELPMAKVPEGLFFCTFATYPLITKIEIHAACLQLHSATAVPFDLK